MLRLPISEKLIGSNGNKIKSTTKGIKYTVSNKSHFYIVKGTPKGESFPTIGWKFHSYKPIEEFAPLASNLAPEYDLEIIETFYNESEVMETWKIQAGHWS